MPLDVQFLKEQAWGYLDAERIRKAAGQAAHIDWNPFKIDQATGKPIGFNEALLQIKGAPVDVIMAIGWAIEKAAYDAGEIAKGSGEAKKEALVKLLDEALRLPFYLEPLDGPIIRIGVDWFIDWLNKTIGKDWINHVKPPELVSA